LGKKIKVEWGVLLVYIFLKGGLYFWIFNYFSNTIFKSRINIKSRTRPLNTFENKNQVVQVDGYK